MSSWSVISFRVAESTIPMLKPVAILYISEARTLRVTLLHFVEDQCIMFPLSLYRDAVPSASLLTRAITKPIWELRSRLLAKELSTKTINLAVFKSIRTFRSLREGFFICQSKHLFNIVQSSLLGFYACAATERLKDASG